MAYLPLEVMQQMSRERHKSVIVTVKRRKKKRKTAKISKPKKKKNMNEREQTMEQREALMAKVKELTAHLKELNDSLESAGIQPWAKKEDPVVILPDLMAEMLAATPKTAPAEAPHPLQGIMIGLPNEVPAGCGTGEMAKEVVKMATPILKPAKKIFNDIQRVPVVEEKVEYWERPPAKYNNIPSPYGIWTEMAYLQLREKTG